MITMLAYAALALVIIGLGYVAFRVARSYFLYRGTRLVICPETRLPAAVVVDARMVAEETVLGVPHLQLRTCSRWPERQDCGQACLSQIEHAPQDCLLKNIVGKWYAEKKCAYCGKPFDNVEDIFHHKPALMGPGGKSLEWDAIRPETLPQVFSTCIPVCWSCHMVETFRREHPNVVMDNPWQPKHDGGPIETAGRRGRTKPV
ncbi:MAG: hypothetical protein ABSB82_16435 [Terriglobia bacterium]